MKKHVKGSPRLCEGSNRLKSAQIGPARKTQKEPCNYWVVKQKAFSTEELNVPGVAVVAESKGRPFAGPFYLDQTEMLRSTLREMPKREKFEVAAGETGFWIYRKPTNA